MNIAELVTTASGGPGSRGKCPPPSFFFVQNYVAVCAEITLRLLKMSFLG